MRRKALSVAAVLAIVLAGCSSSSKSSTPTTSSSGSTSASPSSGGNSGASAPGVTSDSIKIGVITALTGGLSSSYGTEVTTGVQGYFSLINAQGGVDGRKLQMISADDASGPNCLTAAQSLVSRGVFAIITASGACPITAASYLQQNTVPVVGACDDGPEWSDPTNSNMFSWKACNGKGPSYTTYGEYLKQQGCTKLGGVGYGSIISSKDGTQEILNSAKAAGVPTGYNGEDATLTEINFSPAALAMKSAGVDCAAGVMAEAADLGLSTSLSTTGVPMKAELYLGVGYDNQTLSDPTTRQAAQGDSFTVQFQPIETASAGVKTFQQQIKQYANVTGIPGFGFTDAWFSAAMLVAGLQKIGSASLTRQTFISNMHQLSGFNPDGVLPSTVNEATDWGQGQSSMDPNGCTFIVKLQGSVFIPQNNGQAYCGTEIPGADTNGSAPGPAGT